MANFIRSFLFFFVIVIVLFISSCISNVEDLSGGSVIDPSEVSYSQDIQPIFSSSCAGSGCHIPNSTNGVNLSSYEDVMNSIGLSYNTHIVDPGNADGSPIVDKITSDPEFGARMPLTGGYLTNEEIELIKAWIEGGANEN